MASYRVLLFGSNGLVGQALARRAPAEWDLGMMARGQCDFASPRDVGKAVQDFAPDLVINAAAMVDIDACEKDPALAREVNFHAVANLAGQCANIDAPLIHLSTDYVFDGKPDANGERPPYMPDDAMNPVNVYGQTKMMGEEAARHGLYWHTIIRTSLVFGENGSNVLTKTIRQIEAEDEILAVTDQIGNPTSVSFLAAAIDKIASAILKGKGNGFGTFHVCGGAAASRYELMSAIMEAYAPYTSRRPNIIPALTAAMPNRVARPANSAMNNDKARDVYGIEVGSWREDLVKAVERYVQMRDKATSS